MAEEQVGRMRGGDEEMIAWPGLDPYSRCGDEDASAGMPYQYSNCQIGIPCICNVISAYCPTKYSQRDDGLGARQPWMISPPPRVHSAQEPKHLASSDEKQLQSGI